MCANERGRLDGIDSNEKTLEDYVEIEEILDGEEIRTDGGVSQATFVEFEQEAECINDRAECNGPTDGDINEGGYRCVRCMELSMEDWIQDILEGSKR